MIRIDALSMTGKCDLRCLLANMKRGTTKSPISAQKTMLSHPEANIRGTLPLMTRSAKRSAR